MTPRKRFLIGGGGALMPVLVSILAVDVATIIDSDSGMTTGNVVGFVIRYIILFVVGGVVAWLHEDEQKSFKLFELGIAAPALITSLVTAQGVVVRDGDVAPGGGGSTMHEFSIVQQAYAAGGEAPGSDSIVVAGLIGDVLSGITGRAYKEANVRKGATVESEPVVEPVAEPIVEPVVEEVIEVQPTEVVYPGSEPDDPEAAGLSESERIEALEAEAAAARARVEQLERELEAAKSAPAD